MPKGHSPYPPEFRARMVALARRGRTPAELGRTFEVAARSIRRWMRLADRDEGQRHAGLTSDERRELRRLRRENKTLREERALLAKAAAWWARR